MMPQATIAGQLIDLHDVDMDSKPELLIKTESMNVIRLVLPAGKQIAEHKAPKEITVQCVAGEVEFTTPIATVTMTAGKMMFLTPGELHSLKAVDDSIVLVTKAN